MNNTNKSIDDNEIVTVYYCGKYREIVHCKQKTKQVNITKLSKTQYIDNATNEIKEYNYSNCKSVDNFKKQFKNIPRYIKGYFDGDSTEKFITLTYDTIMTDPYRLPYDFKKFMQKIETRYGECRHFYVKEPQENGSWHIHCIIKRLDQKTFNISAETICELWQQGCEISVETPYNIAALPYYFDITRFEHKIARLKYYPPHLKIYGHTEDLKIKKGRKKYIDCKPDDMDKTYSTDNKYVIVNQADGEVYSSLKTIYEQYTKK